MGEARDVMTPAEASEYLQVHIKTIYDWIRTGELRAVKLGPRSTRILKQDILRFLESKAGSAAPDAAAESAVKSEPSPESVAAMSRMIPTRDLKDRVAGAVRPRRQQG